VYGTINYHEQRFRKIYTDHESRVRKHFEGRTGKLLILNICGGEGYEKLCPFLGLPMKDKPFPHLNKVI